MAISAQAMSRSLRFLGGARRFVETDLLAAIQRSSPWATRLNQNALQQLDGDMPTYVNQNTRDEFSHQDFINAYLVSKGARPVNLEPFRTLPSSQATGGH